MGFQTHSPERKKHGTELKLVQSTEKAKRKKTLFPIRSSTCKKSNPFVSSDMLDSEVKRRTGFKNSYFLISCIIFIYNRSIKDMEETCSLLTSFEEWMCFFEIEWGQSLPRWEDAESVVNCNPTQHTLRKVYDFKSAAVLRCRASLPIFSSFEEDEQCRVIMWTEKRGRVRLMMWDDTNVNFSYKPSLSHVQRLTYSPYCGSNCAKGALFEKYSFWMGVHDYVFSRGISDTENFTSNLDEEGAQSNNKGILKTQEDFQNEDLVDVKVEGFYNFLDKGFKITRESFSHHQKLIQPIFREMVWLSQK